MSITESPASTVVITPDALLEHWQGHRRLTRRVIEAFPEDKLFAFSTGGMRPFGELANEFLQMSVPTLRGISTGEWTGPEDKQTSKADVLRAWDADTEALNRLWAEMPPQRLQETHTAFGQWTGTGTWLLLYIIDNEVHHRGQGYVYLRELGIEPPPFYER